MNKSVRDVRPLPFDPEGTGYDMESALKYGMKPDPDTGHWDSRVSQTGLLLKGRKHKTWDLLERGEEEAGYEIYKKDGRYYSRIKKLPEPVFIPTPEHTEERRVPKLPPYDPEYERKVNHVVNMIKGMSPAEQAYMVGVIPFTDPLNATRFMAGKGVRLGGLTSTETAKTVPAIYDAVDRFSANLKLTDPIKWISMASSIGKIILEFRGVPGRGVATRFAARELMTMPTKYESDLSWNEYAEMKGLRTAEAALVGATVGLVSKYVPKARYRIPALTSGYMGFTAVKGGSKQQIVESGITILGFSALGLIEKAAKYPKMRAQYTKLAIDTARRHNPTLYHLTDLEVAKVITGVKGDMVKLGKGRVQRAMDAVRSRMKPSERATEALLKRRVDVDVKKVGISPKEMAAEPREVAVTQKQVKGIGGVTKAGWVRGEVARLRWLGRNASRLDAKYTPKLEAALKKGDVEAAKAISTAWEAELLGTAKAPPTKKPKTLLPTQPPKVAKAAPIEPTALVTSKWELQRQLQVLDKIKSHLEKGDDARAAMGITDLSIEYGSLEQAIATGQVAKATRVDYLAVQKFRRNLAEIKNLIKDNKFGQALTELQNVRVVVEKRFKDISKPVEVPEDKVKQVGLAAPGKEEIVARRLRPNPYRHMPINEVREDAQHGVKLAKEALAHLDPTSAISIASTTPATAKQKQVAHAIKNRHRLTDEQYRRALKYSTGQDSMAKMSIEEADAAIRQLGNFDYMVGLTKDVAKAKEVYSDPLMPKGYNSKIRRAAGSDNVFNKATGYSNKAGGVPSNKGIPDLSWRQERYAQDIVNIANIQRRATRIAAKKEPVGKQYNVVNPWSSARYAMAQAGVKSGVPLRRLYSNIVSSANLVRAQNTNALNAALRRAGAPRVGSPLTFKQGTKIANWLFVNPEKEPGLKTTYWNVMDGKTQKIASEVHKFLQNESAFQVRWARWIKWDRAARRADTQITKLRDKGTKLTKTRLNTIMKPVKKARPPNAPQEALADGRAAEGAGQLLDWLSTQTWGTRKHYYMSEKELVELTNMYPTGTIPEQLEKTAALIGTAPERVLPATMTREGHAKIAKGGSLLNAVLNHANRVGTFAATYDDLQRFWKAFASTNPSPQDIGRVRKLVNTSLGFRHSVDDWVKVARGMNVWFWRPYFAFSLKRATWFSYRNLHQNMAYGLTQVELKEAVKSSKALSATHMGTAMGEKLFRGLDKINPWMREDYSKHWESRISQRRQMYQQFILQKQGSIVSDFGGRATAIIDTLASAPVYSDEINRLQAWPLMHQTAFRNTQQLIKGKISAKKFWSNLGMDTLHVDQRVEMHRLIDAGKWRELVNNYAEYKTENIHFRYETGLRAVSEQTPGGRAVIGLATFPRGTFEIMYQNGLKPFIQGYESGNYRQSYEGLKTMTMGIVGSRMARWMLYTVTGRVAYGITDTTLRYTPVAPGPARLQDMFDVVNETMWRAQEEGRSIEDTAETIMAATMYQIELFLPFCDVMLDIQETAADDYGRRLYSVLKKKARKRFYDETGKKFNPANRDTLDAIRHAFLGGSEEHVEEYPFYQFMLTGKLKKPKEEERKVRRKVP